MSSRLWPIALAAVSLAACDGSDTKIPDSGGSGTTTDSAADTDTDTGLGSGGGSGGSGSGGDGGPRDADGDGFSPEDLTDCDDSNPNIHQGAAEVLGDGVDQDCDGFTDELQLDEVVGLTRCTGAQSPRLTSNGTTTFAGVLCTEALVIPPDEPDSEGDDYFDSALAWSWSHDVPGGPPVALIDWLRNASPPPTTMLSGQGLLATDTALFGATAAESEAGSVLRIGGYDLETERRFSVTYNGPSAEEGFDSIELATDSAGGVHALACGAESGNPRYLGGAQDSIRDSTFQWGTSIGGLGSPSACTLHNGQAGLLTFVSRDTREYTWATVDPTAEPPSSVGPTTISALAPSMLRTATSPGGSVENGAWVVFIDQTSGEVVVQDATTDPSTATTHQWGTLTEVRTVSASLSADGNTLAVGAIDVAGDPVIAVGPPSGPTDTYAPALPIGVGSLDELEVQLSPDASTLWFAGTDDKGLYVGVVALP